MNGQFLANRTISVQYAFRKDSAGERHGSQAERILAANSASQRAKAGPSAASKLKPHTMFAAAPGEVTTVQASQRMVGQARPSGATSGAYGGVSGQHPPHMMGGMPRPMGGMPPPSYNGYFGGGGGGHMNFPPPLPSGAPPMGMPMAPRPSNMPAWMSAGVAPAPGQNIPNAFQGHAMPPPLPAGMPPPLPRQ
jgi:splicing factor 3B subunit 4